MWVTPKRNKPSFCLRLKLCHAQDDLFSVLHFFIYIRKTFFLPGPQFSEHDARNQAEIFLIFFLTFVSLFSLIFVSLGLTLTEDAATINNEDRKDF